MTPDFRGLCEELANELSCLHFWYIEDNGCNLPDIEALLHRVDAALEADA